MPSLPCNLLIKVLGNTTFWKLPDYQCFVEVRGGEVFLLEKAFICEAVAGSEWDFGTRTSLTSPPPSSLLSQDVDVNIENQTSGLSASPPNYLASTACSILLYANYIFMSKSKHESWKSNWIKLLGTIMGACKYPSTLQIRVKLNGRNNNFKCKYQA